MENLSGIAGYGVATKHDRQGGIGLTQRPPYEFVPSTRERFTVAVPKSDLTDGDVVVVWFTVSDIAGNRDDVRMVVGLDRTRPVFTADVEFQTLDEFTSKYVSPDADRPARCCDTPSRTVQEAT